MDSSLITKKIIHAGTKQVNFVPGTKVKFHYVTKTCGDNPKTIDDSRQLGSPMELVIGKQFKLEAWESAIQTMGLNEVSSFIVDKSLSRSYPFVAKTLRDVRKPKGEKKVHCCGATLPNEGVGYEDLNKLITDPCDLEFIFELIQVVSPEEYDKESWQMNETEKLNAIPALKEVGNKFYSEKNYAKAADKYALAIGMLEQLMLKEKPHDVEWNDLNKQKNPILLNYAQCQLINKEYYSVIEHCTTVLSSDPDNVKAYFRRGKAHVGAWNPDEAELDFRKVAELDPNLSKLAQKELCELNRLRQEKREEDMNKFKGKIF